MRTLPFALAGLGLVALAGLLHAGPLDPPSGQIAPSYKTLSQVEPRTPIPGGVVTSAFVINQPGSYYLTDNIKVSAAVDAITINASNVTIDLNGFSIFASNPAASAAIDVPEVEPALSGITVRNGGIYGTFTQGGIRLAYARACLVESVTIRDNLDTGIIAGEGTIVSNCRAFNCMRPFSGDQSTLINCTATGSHTSGTGFYLTNSVARHCDAYDSAGSGFVLASNSLLDSCSARNNASIGGLRSNIFVTGSGNRIDSCTISGGYSSIYIASGVTDNLITRNTFRRGSSWGIIQANQTEGVYPGNHVAQVVADPASPVNTTNPLANIQY